jgi:hypothetical protein
MHPCREAEELEVFVLGTGRCGSTLVHEVLCGHPDVAFMTNTDDLSNGRAPTGRWATRLFRELPPAASKKGRLRLAPSEGYRALDTAVSPMLSIPYRDLLASDATPWLAKRLQEFVERRSVRQGKPVFLHKFTGWPRTGLLSAVFPDARFVHIVRDGRAVANSWLQMPWWTGWRGPSAWTWGPLPPAYEEIWESSGRSFVALAGLNWRVLIDAFTAAGPLLPTDRWLELRYEDVIAEPEKTFRQMLEFCGLDWNREFADRFGRYRFSTSRSAAYRDDLSPAQLDLLEVILSQPLAGYGYV